MIWLSGRKEVGSLAASCEHVWTLVHMTDIVHASVAEEPMFCACVRVHLHDGALACVRARLRFSLKI